MKKPTDQLAKWKTLDRITVLLTEDQKTGLDRIARKIMKFRSKAPCGNDKERITTNTLIRVLIENFLESQVNLPMEFIFSEEELKIWAKKVFK